MHLRENGIYTDRSGRKVGPLIYNPGNPALPWFILRDGKRHTYSATGNYHADGRESEHDLVAEWIEERPARAIDEVNYLDFRRGIAALDKIGRAY